MTSLAWKPSTSGHCANAPTPVWLSSYTKKFINSWRNFHLKNLFVSSRRSFTKVAASKYGKDRQLSSEELELKSYFHEFGVSEKIMDAFFALDRADFIPHVTNPYFDKPQPIGFNATISAPSIHALSLSLLDKNLQPGARVLDVGSGSGFLTAVFGLLVAPNGKVIGIDHIQELLELSSITLRQSLVSDLFNHGVIEFQCADGRLGWPGGAPYDAINVGAAISRTSDLMELAKQLATGGRLVAPVGTVEQYFLTVDKKSDGSLVSHKGERVFFIPLTGELSQRKHRLF